MPLQRHAVSPTATLLRNSRLFSLPPPLPRPTVSPDTGALVTRSSDSATLPYPTHQAVATTPQSLARGDWGFKRPFPSRSRTLQTSDPVVRVTQWDTIEHVTDFESASDHVKTREKFSELSIPMMKSALGGNATDLMPKSAFEEQADVTRYEAGVAKDANAEFFEQLKRMTAIEREVERAGAQRPARKRKQLSTLDGVTKAAGLLTSKVEYYATTLQKARQRIADDTRRSQNGQPLQERTASQFSEVPMLEKSDRFIAPGGGRWKHDGPWLPSMGAAEFGSFIAHEILEHRTDFTRYLRKYAKDELVKRRMAAFNNEDWPLDPEEAEAAKAAKAEEIGLNRVVTVKEVQAEIRTLREETVSDPLGSKLVQKLIIPFLRLPPMKTKGKNVGSRRAEWTQRDETEEFQRGTGPKSTHPSAGLGYLRTKGYMMNHPLLGPQENPTPVPARVVQPIQTATSKENHARFGIAGFVANDSLTGTSFTAMKASGGDARGAQHLELNKYGGQKIWVDPKFASVGADGRVTIENVRAQLDAVNVKNGQLVDAPPSRARYDRNAGDNISGGLGRSGIKELDAQLPMQGLSEAETQALPDAFMAEMQKRPVKSGLKQMQEDVGKAF